MGDERSESPTFPVRVDRILSDFRDQLPVLDTATTSEDESRRREEARCECIDRLARWARREPGDRAVVQKTLFRLLAQDLSAGKAASGNAERERPFSEDRGVNDLMRSYVPIFIGALHWHERGNHEPEDPGLRERARDGLLGRLMGRKDGDHDTTSRELSPTVSQWLIRTLFRVFATPRDAPERLIEELEKLVDGEDTILTQIVILVELGELEHPAGSKLLIKKLEDPTRSGRTAAARALERLGSKVADPERAMEGLCGLLERRQNQAGKGLQRRESTAEALADWEILTDEPLERRAVIRAIAGVGARTNTRIGEAITLLRKEAEQSRDGGNRKPEAGPSAGDHIQETDVAVTAVLALGELGCRLRTEDGGEGGGRPWQRKELERIVTTLTATAARGDPVVAHAAAQALRDVTGSDRAAIGRLLARARRDSDRCEEGRVAEGARLINPDVAIDWLAERLEGADGEWAEKLIARIGGEYAHEVLGPSEGWRNVKFAIDVIAVALVVPALIGAWIAAVDASPPFQNGWPEAWWPGSFRLWSSVLVLSGVLAAPAVLSDFYADRPFPAWARRWESLIRWLSDRWKGARWIAVPLILVALTGTAIAVIAPAGPLQEGWPARWWPQNFFVWSAFFVLSTFFASVVIAFPFRRQIGAARYLVSSIFAFVFSVGMLGTILVGSYIAGEEIAATATPSRIAGEELAPVTSPSRRFGFVHIFRGSYAGPEGGEELIASLMSPPASPGTERAEGFGAPLWVIFVAVLGAAVLTVKIIVEEVRDPPDFRNRHELRVRVGRILLHQFYILFAPFGAMFVYRGLVEADLAGSILIVATAAFGAGLALNLLIKRALEVAGKALQPTSPARVGKSPEGSAAASAEA